MEDFLGIAFGSINTGLPKDIVKQIIEAEKIPIKKMQGRKGKFVAKQGLIGKLSELMTNVKNELMKNGSARSLRELKVETNTELVDVNVDKNIANPGSYQFEVVSLAQKSSALTNGFESPDDSYVGVGFIQYVLPNGEEHEVYVDSENASLNGIAKLINKDSKNGLQATVIDDGSGSDTPHKLLISLQETGDDNKATFPEFYFVDGDDDMFIAEERPARDAVIKIDGFEVEVPGNQVKDLLPGMTVDLKKAKPGEEFSIQIGEDKEAVTGKVVDLVETINQVLAFIKEQNTLDEKTDTSKTLGGDIILQTIEGRIRTAIFKDVETSQGFRRLSDLGITFQRDGTLGFDEKRFQTMASKDFGAMAEILTGHIKGDGIKTQGFVDNFRKFVDLALKFPDGILTTRKKSMQTQIDQVDRRIEQRERMIGQKEKNLKDKFARLEGTISRIQSQGAGLAGMGGGGGANAITQLG